MSLASANPYHYRTEDKSRSASGSTAQYVVSSVNEKNGFKVHAESVHSTSSRPPLRSRISDTVNKLDGMAQSFFVKAGLAPSRPNKTSPAYERPGQISMGY
ncbi:hypothetical protein Slin15195_G098760 [Septoria linicola]|uniref:Uncharacterized protein n=1 Tax=Septoria linicola TaxID=215465 RepID=A0A9Q9AVB6_9PEZI|nr:hypothetical protein Slin14017_G061820 [Septoria linicola]USW56557.1 hypothetical protein Slin15195_G098760 [Septoria linicola]